MISKRRRKVLTVFFSVNSQKKPIVWQHLYFRGHFLLKGRHCFRYVEETLRNRKIHVASFATCSGAF